MSVHQFSYEIWRKPGLFLLTMNVLAFVPTFIAQDDGIAVMDGTVKRGSLTGLPEDVAAAAKSGLLAVVEFQPGGARFRESLVK